MVVSHNTYWLLGWLDSLSADEANQAANLVTSSSKRRDLRDIIQAWQDSFDPATLVGENLVPGTGLNLYDRLTCNSLGCRIDQVNVLFRHAWHYFDRIMLPDAVGAKIIALENARPTKQDIKELHTDISLVVYLRDLGALDLVTYYPRPRFDNAVRAQLAQAVPEETILKTIESVTEQLFPLARFRGIRHGKVHVDLTDPFLNVSASFEIPQQSPTMGVDEYRHMVTELLAGCHLSYLLEDLHVSRWLRGAHATTVWSHEQLLSSLPTPDIAERCAFKLNLPSLRHVPIPDLLRIREADRDVFERFRYALRLAIKEALTIGSESHVHDISAQIEGDIIQPELRRLRSLLQAAERMLARKSVTSVVLGAIATTCGFLLGVPPPVAGTAGVGVAVAAAGKAISEYFDSQKEIELSDMYFLWKALGHVHPGEYTTANKLMQPSPYSRG